jgi:hypothetical protein
MQVRVKKGKFSHLQKLGKRTGQHRHLRMCKGTPRKSAVPRTRSSRLVENICTCRGRIVVRWSWLEHQRDDDANGQSTKEGLETMAGGVDLLQKENSRPNMNLFPNPQQI